MPLTLPVERAFLNGVEVTNEQDAQEGKHGAKNHAGIFLEHAIDGLHDVPASAVVGGYRQVQAIVMGGQSLSALDQVHEPRLEPRQVEAVERAGIGAIVGDEAANQGLGEMGQGEEARRVFLTLIDRYPQSQFVPEAWVRLGDWWFDDGRGDALRRAAEAFSNTSR